MAIGNTANNMGTMSTRDDVHKRRTEEIVKLEILILSKLGNRVRDLRLKRCNKGLILYGYSCTYYAKQLAQHAVLEATNLPLIANEIEVK